MWNPILLELSNMSECYRQNGFIYLDDPWLEVLNWNSRRTHLQRTLARNTQVYIKTSCEVGSLRTSPLCLYVTYLAPDGKGKMPPSRPHDRAHPFRSVLAPGENTWPGRIYAHKKAPLYHALWWSIVAVDCLILVVEVVCPVKSPNRLQLLASEILFSFLNVCRKKDWMFLANVSNVN
jgi:hypothetical protein